MLRKQKIISYLVEHGADLNIADNCGYTPLIITYLIRNEAMVKYLVDRGANTWSKYK